MRWLIEIKVTKENKAIVSAIRAGDVFCGKTLPCSFGVRRQSETETSKIYEVELEGSFTITPKLVSRCLRAAHGTTKRITVFVTKMEDVSKKEVEALPTRQGRYKVRKAA